VEDFEEISVSMLRSFASSPRKVPSSQLARLRALQPIFNQLYDRISTDIEFVRDALGESASACAWGACETDVFRRVARLQALKPRLLLPNSVFLERADPSSCIARFVMSVGNVQAGEPYQLQLVHALQSAEYPLVRAGPLVTHCQAIATAAQLVHPACPCVAILTKPLDSLALRTRIDVRGVGHRLRTEHELAVVYVSMGELAACTLDSNGDLLLGGTGPGSGRRISVIYSRYDFSHPIGVFASSLDEVSAALVGEWATIERLESSSAVISSSLGCRLAHRRGVQRALQREGQLERFLSQDEAAMVRQHMPHQWHLGVAEERAEAELLVRRDPERYVAKNALRPRTGSGATQDRRASGGQIVSGAAELLRLLEDDARARHYIVYRREELQLHEAHLVHGGEEAQLPATISEIASYGAFLADASGAVLTNLHAGFGARTRPSDPEHPWAASLGFGALSCVEPVEG
jgi:hypothetical protein